MKAEDFEEIFEGQINICRDMLVEKAKEYATEDDDRLHNFKIAAELEGSSPTRALGGMMAKHTVSIYDMIFDGKTHTMSQWDEKITDHLNYLFLLKACLIDAARAQNAGMIDPLRMPNSIPPPPDLLERTQAGGRMPTNIFNHNNDKD